MKVSFLFLFLLVAATAVTAFKRNAAEGPGLTGAWQLKGGSEEQVLLFMDGYFTHTTFDRKLKRFVQTRGGACSFTKDRFLVRFEFDTGDTSTIGRSITYSFSQKDDGASIDINGRKEQWQRLDDGASGLSGLWKITARQQQGELQPIHQTGTRKTVKILTATRFQWAAIDPGTRQFMGTGGGSYTFVDGKYTEHIEFFSRDSTRVGSSLSFNGKLENGDWHHSGFSSKGDPIYEVWSRKKE